MRLRDCMDARGRAKQEQEPKMQKSDELFSISELGMSVYFEDPHK